MSPTATVTDAKVLAIVLPIVAVLITAGRLVLRFYNRILALDDGCVGLSIPAILVFGIGTFISLEQTLNRGSSIVLFYALSQLRYSIIWITRLSFLFSLIQTTSGTVVRRVIYAFALAFATCWAFLFAQLFYFCEKNPTWKDSAQPSCPLGLGVLNTSLATDVTANAFLLLIPAALIWRRETSRSQQVHYTLVVGAVSIATVTNIVHNYVALRSGGHGSGIEEIITAIVELSLTLMVANAAIIGTSIWRRLRRPNPIDRWELCRTPSYSLAPAFSSDTLRTIHLSPLSGTQVSYESKTPFRRSPSPALWRQESSGIHVTEEKVSIIHFPHPAVTRDRV